MSFHACTELHYFLTSVSEKGWTGVFNLSYELVSCDFTIGNGII